MTDTAFERNGRGSGAARQGRPDTAARRVAELEAEVAAKDQEIAALANVVGYLTGDIVVALRDTLDARRLSTMKNQVTNIANEIERHRPG